MRIVSKLKDSGGFTLLELMVVILIAGIAGSLVYSVVGRAYENIAFRENSKKIFILLRHAREIAVLENSTVRFKLDEENNSCWLEKNGALVGTKQTMPGGVSIKGKTIIFYPKGNSSGGRIIIIGEKKGGYYIDVDPVLGTSKIKRL